MCIYLLSQVLVVSIISLDSGEEQTLQDSAQATASVPTQESASKLGLSTMIMQFCEY